MRTDSEPYVKRLLYGNKLDGTRGLQLSTRFAKIHREAAAFLDDAQPRRAIFPRDDLIGLLVRRAAELQRSKPVAVGNRVRIGRAGIEALADHQNGFAMFRRAGADPLDVGAERHVTRHFFPNEVKRIGSAPHVDAAPGDAVFAL